MNEIALFKSIKDYFTKKFIFLSIAPLVVPVIILGALFFLGGNEIISSLQAGAKSGNFSFLNEAQHPVWAYILSFSVTQWLLTSLLFVLGTFGVVLFSMVLAVITVGFLTPSIVKTIKARHYVDISLSKNESLLKSVLHMVKTFGIFIFLVFVTLPFLLIPALNFIFFQVPFFYLFYNLMMDDLISTGMCENIKNIVKQNRIYLFIVMFIFYFISVTPFVGLFLQVFFVIYLTHFILLKSKNATISNA